MIFKIAWRNIWRNKKRTLISTLSISGALFLVILMRSMQFGFYDNIIDQVVNSYSGYIQVHADGYWEKQSVNNSMELDDSLIDCTLFDYEDCKLKADCYWDISSIDFINN